MYQTRKQQSRSRPPSSGGRYGRRPATSRPVREDRTPTRDSYPVKGVFGTLLPALQRAVNEKGYGEPTDIQTESIPHLLERRDLYGCAQTGTGKTAAFALPILQHLVQDDKPRQPGRPQALILAPTRELARQIGDSIDTYARYTRINLTVIFGGVGQHPQVKALQRGVNIVVATPGRLLDLLRQGALSLGAVGIFVLDEGDRMLDMGFLPDIRRIVDALPSRRQSLLFSATLPEAIVELADKIVNDPVRVSIAPGQPAVACIDQKVLFVEKGDKVKLLTDLLKDDSKSKVIVFVQMKHVVSRVAKRLETAGIAAASIHGNKSQTARMSALASFKSGRARVLVATDIAARGIDVADVSHVINYDLPQEAETYVHRIGRTGRAGAGGDAVSFCSGEERGFLNSIERLLSREVPVDLEHDLHSEAARRATGTAARPSPRGGRRPSATRRRVQNRTRGHRR